MAAGQHEAAKAYVVYRHERQKEREQKTKKTKKGKKGSAISVVYPNGDQKPLNEKRIAKVIDEACAGLKNIDADAILQDTKRKSF